MVKEPSKQIDQGYSLLFAFALTMVLSTQLLTVSFKSDKNGDVEVSVNSKELNPTLFAAYILSLGGIFGLPTGKIAAAIGAAVSKKVEEDEAE